LGGITDQQEDRSTVAEEPHRRSRALTPEQLEQRFTADGKTPDEVLRLVLAGGPDDPHKPSTEDGKAAE